MVCLQKHIRKISSMLLTANPPKNEERDVRTPEIKLKQNNETVLDVRTSWNWNKTKAVDGLLKRSPDHRSAVLFYFSFISRSGTGATWTTFYLHLACRHLWSTVQRRRTCDRLLFCGRLKRCSHCARHRTTALDALTNDVGRHRTTQRHVVRCRTMSCAVWTPLNGWPH